MSNTKPQQREPLNSRQRSILFAFFDQNPYPSASERQQLVQLTGRTPKQVQDWFSNRRRTDPRLTSGKTTASSPPSSTAMIFPTAYCFPPPTPSPPMVNFCSCCYHPPPTPMFYPVESFYQYPRVNYFHGSS